MKRLHVLLLALGLAALLATPVAAGCRVVHRCTPPVVVEAIPVVPLVAAFLQPQVLAYGAAYTRAPLQQGVAPQQAGPPDAVLAALQRLEQRLGAMEQRAGIAPPQAQTAPMPAADTPAPQEQAPPQGQASADVLKLFTARCASCHARGKEGSGGGFVLLDGPKLAPLSAAKQKQVLQRVYSTDTKVAMPRGGKPLTDEELSTVIGWLATN